MERKIKIRNYFKEKENQWIGHYDSLFSLPENSIQTSLLYDSPFQIVGISEGHQNDQAPLCLKHADSSPESPFQLEIDDHEKQNQENSKNTLYESKADEFIEFIENSEISVQSKADNPKLEKNNFKDFKLRNKFAEALVKCIFERIDFRDFTGCLNINKSFAGFAGFLELNKAKEYNAKQFLGTGVQEIWKMYLKFNSLPSNKSLENEVRRSRKFKRCKGKKCDWKRCECEYTILEYCKWEFLKWDNFMKLRFKSYIDYRRQFYCLMLVMRRRSPDISRSRFDLLWFVACQEKIFICIFSDSNFDEAFGYVKEKTSSRVKAKSDDEIYRDSIDFINECIKVLKLLKEVNFEITSNAIENEILISDEDEGPLKEFYDRSYIMPEYRKIFDAILACDLSKNRSKDPGSLEDFLKILLIIISNKDKPQACMIFKIFEHQLKIAISVDHI